MSYIYKEEITGSVHDSSRKLQEGAALLLGASRLLAFIEFIPQPAIAAESLNSFRVTSDSIPSQCVLLDSGLKPFLSRPTLPTVSGLSVKLPGQNVDGEVTIIVS